MSNGGREGAVSKRMGGRECRRGVSKDGESKRERERGRGRERGRERGIGVSKRGNESQGRENERGEQKRDKGVREGGDKAKQKREVEREEG